MMKTDSLLFLFIIIIIEGVVIGKALDTRIHSQRCQEILDVPYTSPLGRKEDDGAGSPLPLEYTYAKSIILWEFVLSAAF